MSADLNTQVPPAAALNQLREVGRKLLRQGAGRHLRAEWSEALVRLEALFAEVHTTEARLRQERQQLEESYQVVLAHRLRYQELFDFAPDGYLITDALGVIREANHAAALLLKGRRDFLVGKPLAFYVAEAHRTGFYRCLTRLARGQVDSERGWELRLRPPRCSPSHVSVAVAAVRDEAGRCLGLRWVLSDITAAVQTESALRAERVFADSLLDTAQALVLLLTIDGNVLRSNSFARALAGYAEDELDGQNWQVLLPPEEHASARELVRQALAFGVGQRWLGTLLTCDGRQRRIAWSAKALSGDPADEAAVLVLGHDITELEEAQRHALQAERLAAIGQVVASLAHESRNALQRTQACLERLTWRLKGRPEELDLAARARAAQNDLAHLFEEVRTYAAPLRLDVSPCSLADAWREAWQQVQAVFPDQPAALHEQLGGADLWCSGDRFRLTQVFRNIFENAFAACAGPVRLNIVCAEADDDGRPALRVRIADNGPGLGSEPHERLFEPFYTTKPRGSGLGLAIARRLVEAHAGRISAGNSAGGGAEIQITIPRSPP